MKLLSYNINKIKTILFGITLLLFTGQVYAEIDINEVIVSGQVTNYEYGNPVVGHPVIIESEITPDNRSYTKTVFTDSHGFYYDTIRTTKTKGSFFVYTHNHYGEAIDTTVHFRFLERNYSMIFADFNIYLPFQAEEIQAKFKYFQNTTDNRTKYRFFDLTENSNIVSWQWSFGDGTTSTLQNPVHEYSSFGLFRITLHITAIIDGVSYESEISKEIYITVNEYYHMGGHVFSDYFPIDKGYAYLYMVDTMSRYTAIDTVSFDTLGYYYFYQIPKGNYIVKAEPMRESEYYGTLLPTYFGDNLYWEKAEAIDLQNTSWEYNIKLAKSHGLTIGTGGISGNIRYVNSGRVMGDYSAKGVNIHLFDENNNLLTCRYSDDIGDFYFDLVEIETYWLYPEITGISADRVEVELTHEAPIVSDIEINILKYSISSIVEDTKQDQLIGLPYPNPVSESFTLPTKSTTVKNISYEIYDSFGRIVKAGTVQNVLSEGISISTANLNTGMYFIRSLVDENKYDRTFIVVR